MISTKSDFEIEKTLNRDFDMKSFEADKKTAESSLRFETHYMASQPASSQPAIQKASQPAANKPRRSSQTATQPEASRGARGRAKP